MNKDKAICFMCESNEATLETTEIKPICDSCMRTCSDCDYIGTIDDYWREVDGDIWCETCSDSAYYCNRCEELSAHEGSYVQDVRGNWCEGCVDYHATWCDSCEHYTENGCNQCDSDDMRNGVRLVHDYGYRPDAVFHTIKPDERLFFGFELEMELENYRMDGAEYAYGKLEPDDYAYLKNDGSLEWGFELVTHPMSFDFLMDMEASQEVWETIEGLRTQYEARSYHTDSCGFHVHVSRTGFRGGVHMHNFLNLIYSNPEFYQKVAGRKSSQWAKFDDVYISDWDEVHGRFNRRKTFSHKLRDNSRGWANIDSERYSAVNTRNRATLEVRIFKGSMDRNALKAYIQLVHASVEYTRSITVQNVKDGLLGANNLVDYIIDNYNIYPQLLERLNKKQLLSPSNEYLTARSQLSTTN